MASGVPTRDLVTTRLIGSFKALISDGSLVPGCKLPPERELAKSFGVCRASLRQAWKVLENMGVLSQRVGDGTYVNEGAPEILAEPMEFLILLGGISFKELAEARLLFEPEQAARAAERATVHDVAFLRDSLETLQNSSTSHDEFTKSDLAFHHKISEAAGNRACTMMFSVIHRAMLKMIELTSQLVDREHTIAFHKQIYDAIAIRDPEAARRAMNDHMVDVSSLLERASVRRVQSTLAERISSLAASY